MPVCPGMIHLLPELEHLLARDHRIGVAVAHEYTRGDLARFGRQRGVEQSMEAYRRFERCAVTDSALDFSFLYSDVEEKRAFGVIVVDGCEVHRSKIDLRGMSFDETGVWFLVVPTTTRVVYCSTPSRLMARRNSGMLTRTLNWPRWASASTAR